MIHSRGLAVCVPNIPEDSANKCLVGSVSRAMT